MRKIINEILNKEASIDSMTVEQAIKFLQRYDNSAEINFLTRWECDVDFEITLKREQTQQEYDTEHSKLKLLKEFQEQSEKELYERLKMRYEGNLDKEK